MSESDHEAEGSRRSPRPRKRRRRARPIAIVVGVSCFLLSLGICGVLGFILFGALHAIHPTLPEIGKLVLGLPLVVGAIWLTALLMEAFESATGISLRTTSARGSGGDRPPPAA